MQLPTVAKIARHAKATFVDISYFDLNGSNLRIYSFHYQEEKSYYSEMRGMLVVDKTSCLVMDKKLDRSNFSIRLKN